MRPLVECVPNFSEARRPEVVQAIVAAIEAGGGAEVRVINVSSDNDHNRTVVTFVGSPAGVEAAAFAGIAQAAALIDLNVHRGEHPRLGATDVVPFIPIRDVTMADCVALAKHLGERVGRELNIPVYLYEAAATRPERTNLENVRRGEYEKLKDEIATNPAREPDYGPRQVGPAGGTVIGARQFLVAYNIYLNTANVDIAKKIAKAVRHSSGGLRYVKGMGVLVEGQAQVSMNLTDFTQTPIARVQEFVRREAMRYGVSIAHSELVGMIPQTALVDAAQWYLQLDNLEPGQILENKIGEGRESAPAGTRDQSAGEAFVESLAAGTAAPGGGSASAYAGAMAAALVGMLARLTLGKKKYADVEAQMQSVLESADRLRADLTAAVSDDSAAFVAVMEAFKLPASRESGEQQAARAEAIQAAYAHAAEVPLRVARGAVAALGLAAIAVEKGNVNAISDGGSAAYLARAALSGAGLNVRANAQAVKDREAATAWLQELHGLETRANETLAAIEKTLRERK
jgi:glutamate formiminotransferase/formiminotetrahydrofolate cyclodeaminase